MSEGGLEQGEGPIDVYRPATAALLLTTAGEQRGEMDNRGGAVAGKQRIELLWIKQVAALESRRRSYAPYGSRCHVE